MNSDTPAARVRKVLSAPPEVVFAAWLNPVSVKQWMSPVGTASLTLDPRVGGRFHLVMSGEGMEIDHEGEYQVIEPPTMLQFTWRSRFTGNRDTLVTVRFEPHGTGQTLVLITHEGLTEDEAASHGGGWSQILERLEDHVR